MKKDSWLYSDSFLKRAFAIWGHYFVANLLILAATLVVIMLLMATFGLTIASFYAQKERNDRMPVMNEDRGSGTQGGMGVTGGIGR